MFLFLSLPFLLFPFTISTTWQLFLYWNLIKNEIITVWKIYKSHFFCAVFVDQLCMIVYSQVRARANRFDHRTNVYVYMCVRMHTCVYVYMCVCVKCKRVLDFKIFRRNLYKVLTTSAPNTRGSNISSRYTLKYRFRCTSVYVITQAPTTEIKLSRHN